MGLGRGGVSEIDFPASFWGLRPQLTGTLEKGTLMIGRPGVRAAWHPLLYFSEEPVDVTVSVSGPRSHPLPQLLPCEPTESNSEARQLVVSFLFLIRLQ